MLRPSAGRSRSLKHGYHSAIASDYGRALVCPECGAPFGAIAEAPGRVPCSGCGASYPVQFGIIDLRVGRYAVADGEFDADDDLREAGDLAASFRTMSHREWFFSGVDDTLGDIADPKMRQMAQAYYRAEREVYGIHGDAVLNKLWWFLAEREPARLRAWPSGIALEAGCGTGQYPIGFARRFAHVYVTDLSYVSLVQARQVAVDEGLANVTIFASNIERLPLRDGSIDFVHCNSVLEHVADPDRIVAETARVLSQHGVAFYLSPNRHTLYVEPHFNIIAFSFWPMPLRRWLVRRYRGKTSFAGTRLRSLRELRRWASGYFARHYVFFLPRRLERTAMGGPVRRAVRALLGMPIVGTVLDLILNRWLLAVMPYHILVGLNPYAQAAQSELDAATGDRQPALPAGRRT